MAETTDGSVSFGSLPARPVEPCPDRGLPMRRRTSPPPQSGGGRPGPPRDPRPGDFPSHIVLVSSGIALYLAVLWLGVVIIDDSLPRSAVMAGVIVAIAGVGYIFTHQPTRPGGR